MSGLGRSLMDDDGDADVHDAELDVDTADNGLACSVPAPHCACAFCMTLLLSSRNIKDS